LANAGDRARPRYETIAALLRRILDAASSRSAPDRPDVITQDVLL